MMMMMMMMTRNEAETKMEWNEFEGFGEWIVHGKVLDEWIL